MCNSIAAVSKYVLPRGLIWKHHLKIHMRFCLGCFRCSKRVLHSHFLAHSPSIGSTVITRSVHTVYTCLDHLSGLLELSSYFWRQISCCLPLWAGRMAAKGLVLMDCQSQHATPLTAQERFGAPWVGCGVGRSSTLR